MKINSKVRVVGFGSSDGLREWEGTLKGKTANNISVVRDGAGRDWAVPNNQIFNVVPLKVRDIVTSTLGEGTSRFEIVTTEIDRETGEELYICRSMYSDATWSGRKRYAYSNSELALVTEEETKSIKCMETHMEPWRRCKGCSVC